MNTPFDFDRVITREATASLKYDARQDVFGCADLIPLWVADMDFATPPAVTRALTERAAHPIYGYTTYPDSLYDALISWLKRRHDWEVEREWIVMCPGVVPSLHAAVMAIAKPSESVIVQPPVYFPFFSAVTNLGRQLVENPLRFENDHYTIDFEHLEQCAANARMLLLCSPHNPVGRVWRKTELERLLQIAEKHDLIIFSDEIHADLIYPDGKHHILATLSGHANHIITAVAPSKTFNIPGLNLSALIIPDATHRAAINKAFDTLHVSAANPFSLVAFEAAYSEGELWLDELLVYLKQTRDFVADYLTANLPQIRLVAPQGTYLLWLDCRALGISDAELKHFFVHEAGVGLSPGILFGEAGSGFMRMNIGAPRRVIVNALGNIVKALANN
ncbi:MAG: pyridoxal phosphate-dependent aminotransferase [Methylotenera sp.]|nr:pyridoxal phosphate-dependent aminotransferase [Methylotenera sp.]MDP2101233.1 pyridoxal phosphate-dependent aminotransferase [Methylotenera sp.]MDP2280671.1 pyridoxal phosphate-dependent aminotransferase [Methylotenera sp.]MDP2404457.1 pyridoxal phosphate-dependent aminotransferase [Methylotenera sp.]MDP3060659.1 pyridoxal phosphate-dependent aminotransferase [Methylotenera sp.]